MLVSCLSESNLGLQVWSQNQIWYPEVKHVIYYSSTSDLVCDSLARPQLGGTFIRSVLLPALKDPTYTSEHAKLPTRYWLKHLLLDKGRYKNAF